MKRRHLVEIHEQPWCPEPIRRLATDYLHTVSRIFRAFEPIVPVFAELLRGQSRVVDLCSGGTGPTLFLAERVRQAHGLEPDVVLTDLYPNLPAFERAAASTSLRVRGEPRSVDARNVPTDLVGARTLFDAFHHFRPEDARKILADAAAKREPLLIVEATQRSLPAIIGMVLFVPFLVLLLTPWVRPLTFSRLLFTYLVPIAVPLIVFDGVVSCLRTYTPAELADFTNGLEGEAYEWQQGQARSHGQALTWLLGRPLESIRKRET